MNTITWCRSVSRFAGLLVEAQARLVGDALLAGTWVASGERHLPRRMKATNASPSLVESLPASGTDPEAPPETPGGLPSIDALFNAGASRS